MKLLATILGVAILFSFTTARSTSHSPRPLSNRSRPRGQSSRHIILNGPESFRRATRRQDVSDATPSGPILIASHSQPPSETTSNWAGAILKAHPDGKAFNAVSGQFVVPVPQMPPGGWGDHFASIWVGIDGYELSHLLQAGVTLKIDLFGSISYTPWYQWLPNSPQNIPDLLVSAGDQIRISIASSNPSTGQVTIDNLTAHQQSSFTVHSPGHQSNLVGHSAEWIVEDSRDSTFFGVDSRLVPFLNFGSVVFNDIEASAHGEDVNLQEASLENIQQGQDVLTNIVVDSDRQVTITWF